MPSPFGDIIQHQIDQAGEAFLKKRRPPVEIRGKLDIACRTENLDLYIVEIRPAWNNPAEMMEQPVAKATFVKSKGIWKVFWIRGNLKWYPYPEQPQVKMVVEFFDLVDEDKMGCFFG
ncbi:MAG: DUF3024 domain-containing protein [Cryomorphaceae bacterium]